MKPTLFFSLLFAAFLHGCRAIFPTNSSCPSVCEVDLNDPRCCPYQHGVCCPDARHCCAQGSFCSIENGIPRCVAQDQDFHISESPAKQLYRNASSPMICPDRQTVCSNGFTCCASPVSSSYNCCPMKNAVCCTDGQHCCPHGYQCDVTTKSCISLEHGLRTSLRSTTSSSSAAATKPQFTVCGDRNCPLPDAECCGKYCCPRGFACNIMRSRCEEKRSLGFPALNWMVNLQLAPNSKTALGAHSNRLCPDDKTQCPNQSTCCRNKAGNMGCCPLPSAVCCADKEHCCPSHTRCDLSTGQCLPAVGKTVPLVETTSPRHACADRTDCPDFTTCCKLDSGNLGCCGYSNAVCCAGGEFCCAHGYACAVGTNGTTKCVHRKDLTLTSVPKPVMPRLGDYCPDGSFCHESSTCCKMSEGYGCCPLQYAVCCKDGKHCCPHATVCSDRGCLSAAKIGMPAWSQVDKAIASPRLAFGHCPHEKGTCCQDGNGCCPGGVTCTADGRCGDGTVERTPLTAVKTGTVGLLCPSTRPACPYGTTECGDKCCPMLNAVCCANGKHCCPGGTDCRDGRCVTVQPRWDIETVTTSKPAVALGCPPGQKAPCPGATGKLEVGKNMCPDKRTQCPDNTTCCSDGQNKYKCCPYQNAQCCSDNEHCCPHDYSCDSEHARCVHRLTSLTVTLMRKFAGIAVARENEETAGVLCEDGSRCPTGSSCCGAGKCCPYPAAQCCGNGDQCCPEGFECAANGKCVHQLNNLIEIEAARKTEAKRANRVMCPDGVHYCRDGAVCCQDPQQMVYRCCNHPGAVCCPDGKHCCPHGTHCDPIKKHCVRPRSAYATFLNAMQQAERSKPKQAKKEHCPDEMHKCPGETLCDMKMRACRSLKTGRILAWQRHERVCVGGKRHCPVGSTCCHADKCCPFKNAVCCSDGQNCCPEGFTCDVEGKGCLLDQRPMQASEVAMMSVACPEKSDLRCAKDSTCCQLKSGNHSCCPFANGVCCQNGQYCCPHGASCEAKSGRCVNHEMPGGTVLWAKPTTLPVKKDDPLNKISCETCARLDGQCCANGGCCLLDGGVCCGKVKTCCPRGSRCTLNGQCTSEAVFNIVFPSERVVFHEHEVVPQAKALLERFRAAGAKGSAQPAISNVDAVAEPRLMNDRYRMIKATRWNVCPGNAFFCPSDAACCADSKTCAPRGTKCCGHKPTSCPEGFQCSADGLTCVPAA